MAILFPHFYRRSTRPQRAAAKANFVKDARGHKLLVFVVYHTVFLLTTVLRYSVCQFIALFRVLIQIVAKEVPDICFCGHLGQLFEIF
jgi:hypothetical protein